MTRAHVPTLHAQCDAKNPESLTRKKHYLKHCAGPRTSMRTKAQENEDKGRLRYKIQGSADGCALSTQAQTRIHAAGFYIPENLDNLKPEHPPEARQRQSKRRQDGADRHDGGKHPLYWGFLKIRVRSIGFFQMGMLPCSCEVRTGTCILRTPCMHRATSSVDGWLFSVNRSGESMLSSRLHSRLILTDPAKTLRTRRHTAWHTE